MTPAAKDRPTLAASVETLMAPSDSAAPKAAPVGTDTGPTSTLSLRVPTAVFEKVNREIRRLHFETGQSKGAIGAELLEEGLRNIEAVIARLSTK